MSFLARNDTLGAVPFLRGVSLGPEFGYPIVFLSNKDISNKSINVNALLTIS